MNFLRKFVSKYRVVGKRGMDLPKVEPSEPVPSRMHDPVNDKHPTRQRINVQVDPLHHGLHLSLPPAPAKSVGPQGFAVIHTHDEPAMHAAIHAELAKVYHTGRIAAREWHNAHGEEAVAPGHGEGRYVSLRGDASLVRHIVNRSKAGPNVAHASENTVD